MIKADFTEEEIQEARDLIMLYRDEFDERHEDHMLAISKEEYTELADAFESAYQNCLKFGQGTVLFLREDTTRKIRIRIGKNNNGTFTLKANDPFGLLATKALAQEESQISDHGRKEKLQKIIDKFDSIVGARRGKKMRRKEKFELSH